MADAAAPSAANVQGALHLTGYLGGRRKKKPPLSKQEPRTLYVQRPVLNAADIIAWAKTHGFNRTLPADDLHVTIAFSRRPLAWPDSVGGDAALTIPAGSDRAVAQFAGGAVVLRFTSPQLTRRWSQIINAGASWDWPDYHPHITITNLADEVDWASVAPFLGEIILGPEQFAEVDESWKDKVVEKMQEVDPDCDPRDRLRQSSRKAEDTGTPRSRNSEPVSKRWTDEVMQKVGARHSQKDMQDMQAMHDIAVRQGAKCPMQQDDQQDEEVEKSVQDVRIAKVDDNLGVVFGYAIVCKHNGEPYYDLNIDPSGKRVPEHIPEGTMLKAALDFMQNSRAGNEMHAGPDTGTFVFAYPLTTEIAKSLGIQTATTGLLVGFKPTEELFAKFKDGTYKGFSIEGKRLVVQELDD